MLTSAEKRRLIASYRDRDFGRGVVIRAAVGLLTIVVVTTLGVVAAPESQVAGALTPPAADAGDTGGADARAAPPRERAYSAD